MRRAVAVLVTVVVTVAFPASAVTRADVEQEIRAVFGPAAPKALRVARCESRLVPTAVGGPNRNGTKDWGVFQLNDGGTLQALGLTREQALDYKTNIRAAHRLYRQRGWQPWTCR